MEVLIRGIGAILTGEFSSPRIEGDAVLIRDGLIAAAGPLEEIGAAAAETVIDACGATLALVDGEILVKRSRNTAPARRQPNVTVNT